MAEFSDFVAWEARKINEVFMRHLINQDMRLTKAQVRWQLNDGLGCQNGFDKWLILLDKC